ncbi:MAG: response regulator [Planctomycetota bacterium]|jgi:excisionase family DNA binding protein
MQSKQILTTGEIAKYCGVNFRTVIRWIERGRLKAYQLPGRGDNRVTVEDFVDFLKENNMPVPEEFSTRDRRVLIVESDPALAQQVESTLQTQGFETTIASDGFHAGSLLGTFKPSVMFLDLRIPGLSANDVVNFVKKASGMDRVKVLIVSTEGNGQSAPGADSYLNVPFSSEELVSKVNELLQPSYA